MKVIEVEGMRRLSGEVCIQGSKNAALPILSACVLGCGETILHGCPQITDVYAMLDVLTCAGASVRWETDGTLLVDTGELQPLPLIENAGATRSTVMLLGSFLARFGKAVLGYPGGCRIGRRPIDLHEQALGAMGAVFQEEEAWFEARCQRLEGCDLYLPYPSVGVTENILLAASGASGMTRIFGAAQEPEIGELCRFLTAAGVRIDGIGTANLSVMGGAVRKHTEFTICPDRIVAGTYLLAAAAAGGTVVLKNAPLEQMQETLRLTGRLGAELKRSGSEVKVTMNSRPQGIPFVGTAPYPGFPTDLQSPLLSVLCRAEQKSRVEERIFENRFLVVEELQKMGADIRAEGRAAWIRPAERLTGAQVQAKDLRGGAALLIAALEAEGKSKICGAKIIDRGYEDIVRDLRLLGAEIC